MFEWDTTWTAIDDYPNLVTSYTIDRGRQYELDRTDVGRAAVSIADVDGILDPTNPSGPFFGKIEPLVQAAICRWNPVADEWNTRFRGFVEEIDYAFDPSQQVNRLTITLIDIFEILSAVQLFPGQFGDPPPQDSLGQVFYDNAQAGGRIRQVMTNAIGASAVSHWGVIFTGNVELFETVHSPGESAMSAIQEAADAEFPGVSNVYTDRFGRLCFHGRLAKFDPVGTAASTTPDLWDFQQWKAGDGAAVHLYPGGTAHIRSFAFNRGLAKIINQGLGTPLGIADADVEAQTVVDDVSIGRFGIRSWSAQNLITKRNMNDPEPAPGDLGPALAETRRFAEYYVANYAQPRNRVTEISFRPMRPTDPRAAATWALLSKVDIADLVTVSIDSPGGGGFLDEPYFVEGVHERCEALNANYDDVTIALDLSPQAYFSSNPFPEPT